MKFWKCVILRFAYICYSYFHFKSTDCFKNYNMRRIQRCSNTGKVLATEYSSFRDTKWLWRQLQQQECNHAFEPSQATEKRKTATPNVVRLKKGMKWKGEERRRDETTGGNEGTEPNGRVESDSVGGHSPLRNPYFQNVGNQYHVA
jgi:hypothetical protein